MEKDSLESVLLGQMYLYNLFENQSKQLASFTQEEFKNAVIEIK